jgi:hypothetical protein
MIDPFLDEIFMSNAITAALGRNKIYAPSCIDSDKQAFRERLAKWLRVEARRYATAVSDGEHYVTIGKIADVLSEECRETLCGGRLRYGTAQKAFNLYLKFLWRSGCIPEPPHCPIDRVVLGEAGIDGSWTKCDCEGEYMKWIDALKTKAKPLGLSEWEHSVWLKGHRG